MLSKFSSPVRLGGLFVFLRHVRLVDAGHDSIDANGLRVVAAEQAPCLLIARILSALRMRIERDAAQVTNFPTGNDEPSIVGDDVGGEEIEGVAAIFAFAVFQS